MGRSKLEPKSKLKVVLDRGGPDYKTHRDNLIVLAAPGGDRAQLAKYVAFWDALGDPVVRRAVEAACRELGGNPADVVGVNHARMLDPSLVGHCVECRTPIRGNAAFCETCTPLVRERGEMKEKAIRALAEAIGPKVLPRCERCGAPFLRNAGAKYCSVRCAGAQSMKRNRSTKPSRSAAAKKREARRQAKVVEKSELDWFKTHSSSCVCCGGSAGRSSRMCAEGRKHFELYEKASAKLESAEQEYIDGNADAADWQRAEDDDPTTL